ncbi:hypothetical protein GCM10017083_05730 [Thalassobaculum fulvum]|uniref:Uncharacterized protein n=1 Tax=Thalassobaculum fulvum TaxID=1633335 RepID=A0A919CP74_9PROT|nr:hypothetical protein GCM10017083_05730 [Thalassobaculum fulvum]
MSRASSAHISTAVKPIRVARRRAVDVCAEESFRAVAVIAKAPEGTAHDLSVRRAVGGQRSVGSLRTRAGTPRTD